MLKFLILPVGLMLGAAGAFTAQIVQKYQAETAQAQTSFIPVGAITIPLVMPDGRLSTYLNVTAELEVSDAAAARVGAQLPLLLNAVNMQAFRAPLSRGPDGRLPRFREIHRLIDTAATATFGRAAVRRVVVTQITPQ